jgi:hypothetical protein
MVRARCIANANQPTGRLLLARDLHSLFRVSFASDVIDRARRSFIDEISMNNPPSLQGSYFHFFPGTLRQVRWRFLKQDSTVASETK